MTVPRNKVDWAERVVVSVETSPGSGAFETDDRLRAETVEVLSDANVAVAELAVRTDDGFDPADAAARYYPDRRIIVQTESAVLFDGYPATAELAWTLGGHRAVARRPRTRRDQGEGFGLILEHVVGRLGRDVRARIIGRYVRDGIIADGLAQDPDPWAGVSVLASGLPCIFNMGGVPNCDPAPITVDDGAGGTREIHIFTDDASPAAIPWTFARVLRYLLHFYTWPGCPVDAQSVFDQTDSVATLSGIARASIMGSDGFSTALLGRPDTLVLEATSLLETLALIASSSGLHMTAESQPAGQGVRTAWRVWSQWSDARRELRLATAARDASGVPLYDASSIRAVDLFDNNNVSASSIRWDARPTAATALVVGDVKRYAATMELLPGWLPQQDLDNVDASDRAAAKAKALSDELILALGTSAGEDNWYRSYHRDGADFETRRDVGRKWVLNEAGAYAPTQYVRNAPFDSYTPFDFSVIWEGRWMRRRRRLLPASVLAEEPARVWADISFDGGQSWTRLDAGYGVLADECGIWLDVPNLLSIAPSQGGGETNLWYALIDQQCRVRVTALIESDDRLIVDKPSDSAPTLLQNAAVLYEPARFQFLRQAPSSGGQAASAVSGGAQDRDDTPAMREEAAAAATALSKLAVAGQATIPWLDTDYAPGDPIVGVRGRGVSFDAERAPSRRHACIVGKRYRFGHGRFETQLILSSAGDTPSGETAEG